MTGPSVSSVPRVALRVGEAARAIGVSDDFFAEHVAPELRWTRRGAVKLVAVAELERWLRESASLTLDLEDVRPSACKASGARISPANRAVRATRAPETETLP